MDIFARIGAALEHLVQDSTLNGAKKEEVQQLSSDLRTYEASVPQMISDQVTAQVAAATAGVASKAYVDNCFAELATALEAEGVTVTPPAPADTPPPAPVAEPAPAPEAAPAEEPPVTETAAPDTGATVPAEPIPEPAPGADTVSEPVPGSDTTAQAESAMADTGMTMVAGGGSDVIE